MNPDNPGGARSPATGGARKVVLLSKRGCHLCEAVEAEIRSMTVVGAALTVVNIDEDSVLHDKYWLRVPVVRVEGEDVFEARMMD
ncbi:MAG: glutaredoxin family protein [Nitrososphaerales archaeon]|nr:glutaredoxin family protein [Nitrososphaerales archaeon]